LLTLYKFRVFLAWTGESDDLFNVGLYRAAPTRILLPEVSARRSATSPGRPVYRRRLQTVVASLALQSPRSWLLVPWTRTSTGQRSFAVYDPRTWNRLPTALRSPELSLASFKRQLKTHSSVPALDSAGCSCGCRLPSSHRRCCDCTASSAPTTNVQTRLDYYSDLRSSRP